MQDFQRRRAAPCRNVSESTDKLGITAASLEILFERPLHVRDVERHTRFCNCPYRKTDCCCGWGLPTMQSAPDGRLNRLVLTPEGRNAFARFVDHSEVPVEIERFLRENP